MKDKTHKGMIQMEDNDYTLGNLKEFLATLDDEQLNQKVNVAFEDCPVQEILGHEIQKHDYWANKEDTDDCGTIEELKAEHGVIDTNDYMLITPKGTIYFF